MSNITSEEKTFIKRNKEILAGLFVKKIEELKENVLTCPDAERGSMILMINEIKKWLLEIKVFTKKKSKDKADNFI